MTIVTNPTPDFHERVRSGERVLSYSQISRFLTCRHAWYLTYYLGIHQPVSLGSPLTLGDCVHQCAAHFLMNYPITADYLKDPLQLADLVTEWVRNWVEKELGRPTQSDLMVESMINAADNLATQAIHSSINLLRQIAQEGWVPLRINPTYPDIRFWDEQSIPSPNDHIPEPILGVELELRTELPTAPAFDHFASHIDLLAHHPATNRVWVVDYKNRQKFTTSPSFEDVNLQAMIYACMCLFHSLPVTGTATLEVLAQLPAIPSLNKDGSMSRTKIATTWDIYERELKRNFLDPLDYADMRWKLTTQFVRLTKEHRPVDALNKVWTKLVLPTAELMSDIIINLDEYHKDMPNVGLQNVHGQPRSRIQRSLGHFQCNGCGVRDVCLAGLYDRDIRHIIEQRKYNPITVALALETGGEL